MIANARQWRRHPHYADRVAFTEVTDGGRHVSVIARYEQRRDSVRPIAAWEEQ